MNRFIVCESSYCPNGLTPRLTRVIVEDKSGELRGNLRNIIKIQRFLRQFAAKLRKYNKY